MIPTVIDIAIILTLAFFAWRGAKKGLILTLFSLLAVFVAWFGAKAVAENFTAPVANIIRPSIRLTIEEALEGAYPAGTDAAASPSPSVPAVILPGGPPAAEEEPAGSGFTLQQVLDTLDQSELFVGLRDFLDEAVEENLLKVTTTATEAVSAYLAQLIASSLLFALSFLLILLVWFLVSRAMDLAFRLPILSAVNGAGGAALGLVKGVLLILVLVWAARLAGILTDANAGPVARLMTVQGLSRALNGLIQDAAAGFTASA